MNKKQVTKNPSINILNPLVMFCVAMNGWKRSIKILDPVCNFSTLISPT